MKTIITIIFLIVSLNAFSQNQTQSPPPPPPPEAIPKNDIIPLIAELIDKSNMEKAFMEYCYLKILVKGSKLKWSEGKIKQVYSIVNFQDIQHSIYNYFAPLTKTQLEESIKLFELINKDNKAPVPSYFLTTPGIMNNFDNYINRIIDNQK
jgi:hypothetical protein